MFDCRDFLRAALVSIKRRCSRRAKGAARSRATETMASLVKAPSSAFYTGDPKEFATEMIKMVNDKAFR